LVVEMERRLGASEASLDAPVAQARKAIARAVNR